MGLTYSGGRVPFFFRLYHSTVVSSRTVTECSDFETKVRTFLNVNSCTHLEYLIIKIAVIWNDSKLIRESRYEDSTWLLIY